MKNIYLIVGESGAGKTTIANELEKFGYKQIQSYTTREPRYKGETGHTFINESEMPDKSEMVAYTLYNGNHYFATKQQVEENDLYVIDPDGIKFFKNTYKGNKGVRIIYISAPEEIRRRRMIHRENPTTSYEYAVALSKANSRIAVDKKVFFNVQYCRKFANINLSQTVHEIKNYINQCEMGVESSFTIHKEYEKAIYISHPYGGDKTNLEKVAAIIESLRIIYSNYLFISPLHAFSHEYDKIPYEDGIKECLWLLSKCDECWLFGDYMNSRGCKIEKEYCNNHNIPCRDGIGLSWEREK